MQIVLSDLGFSKSLTFSSSSNAYLSTGYTSNAGNTYFNAFRLSQNLVIKEDVGQGYARTFLNGIKVFTKEGVLIAEERYNCCFYSLETVKAKSTRLLVKEMLAAAKRKGVYLQEGNLHKQVENEVRQSIELNPKQFLLR